MIGSADGEGVSFLGALRERFARGPNQAKQRLETRIKRERRAGMTEAERSRRGPAKAQFNQRVTFETRALFDALASHHAKSMTEILAMAAEALAKVSPGLRGGPK